MALNSGEYFDFSMKNTPKVIDFYISSVYFRGIISFFMYSRILFVPDFVRRDSKRTFLYKGGFLLYFCAINSLYLAHIEKYHIYQNSSHILHIVSKWKKLC